MPSAMCSPRAKFFNPQKVFFCFLKKWGLKTLLERVGGGGKLQCGHMLKLNRNWRVCPKSGLVTRTRRLCLRISAGSRIFGLNEFSFAEHWNGSRATHAFSNVRPGPHMPSAMCSARAKFFNPQKAFVCFLKKWGLKTLLYGCSFRREQFDRRACPYVEVEPKLKGLSQERSCHKWLRILR